MVAKMASDAENRINLTSLQRRDPYISNILDSATQVAVYTFNHKTSEWEKTEVEGTLFVYSRIAPPYAGFTIMNRLSMENLTEPLTSDVEFQNQHPFLLYRNAKLNIFGIWFYDLYDCTRIGKLLADQCAQAKKGTKNESSNSDILHRIPSPNSLGSSSTSSLSDNVLLEDDGVYSHDKAEEVITSSPRGTVKQPANLMGMLFKAKEDYNKTHGITSQLKAPQDKGNPDPLSQLFKPIKSEKARKVNVASLFESTEASKSTSNSIARASSAEIFAKILPSNGTVNNANGNYHQQQQQHQQRRTARSLSLCLGNTPPNPEMASAAIVNGAISVEELESPVLGTASSGRGRFHSVSEGYNSRNNPSPKLTTENESAFNKLLSKMAVSTSSSAPVPTSVTKPMSVASFFKGNASQEPVFQQQACSGVNFLQRQSSLPIGDSSETKDKRDFANLKLYSTSPSTSFVASSNLPPVLEQSAPYSRSMGAKSMSVATGLANIKSANAPSPLRVSGLHGTTASTEVNLLSPDVLRSSIADDSDVASSLGFPTIVPKILKKTDGQSVPTKESQPITAAALGTGEPSKLVTLISPEDFEHYTNTPHKANELRQRLLPDVAAAEIKNMLLTKQQLADTLVQLLQTDQSFVAEIHAAYVSGLSQNNHGNTTNNPLAAVWK